MYRITLKRRYVIIGDTLADLRDKARKFIDAMGYGMSDIGGRFVVKGHPEVRHMSYNGRFWNKAGLEVQA